MTWITPLLVNTSVAEMLAVRPTWSVICKLAFTVRVSPCAVVIGEPTGTSALKNPAGHHVIGQDAGQQGCVGKQGGSINVQLQSVQPRNAALVGQTQ